MSLARVDGSAIQLKAKASSANAPIICVLVGWTVTVILCVSIMSSSNDGSVQLVFGITLVLVTILSCWFIAYNCSTNAAMARAQRAKAGKSAHVEIRVDPLSVCALCGAYLGEICKMHSAKEAKEKPSCPVTRGKCGHTYHFHCVAIYLDQCAASRRDAMCPDVTDPFLWEFDLRRDRKRYSQWMKEHPIRRSRSSSHGRTDIRSPGSPARRAASSRHIRRVPSISPQISASYRNAASPGHGPPSPGFRPTVDVLTRESSRRRMLSSPNSVRVLASPSNLAAAPIKNHHTAIMALRQIPAQMKKMKSTLERAKADVYATKAKLEREAHQTRMESLRSKEAVRNAHAAWQRQTKTVEELKGEIENLRDQQLCAVCLEVEKNTAFQCGHQTCFNCAQEVTKCPFCRQDITARIKLFN